MTGGRRGCGPITTGLLTMGMTVALAGPATGQIRLIPQVGLYVPQADLGQVGSGDDAIEVAKRESTLGYGVALELGTGSRLGLRVGGVYGSQSEVPVGGVGCAACEARSSVLALTGALVLRPLPALPLIRPFLMGGAGVKRYNFDIEGSSLDDLGDVLNDQEQLNWHVGGGTELNLGLLTLMIEVSDYFGGFDLGSDADTQEGETQHDFFATVGLSLGG